jgi:TPR repeat protein
MSIQVPKPAAALVLFAALVVAAAVNGHGLGSIAQSIGHYKFARFFFTVAALSGNGPSQNNLAALYAGGRGGNKDDRAAAKWFQRAADDGIVQAKFNLSNFYEEGRGVERNTATAVRLLREAATAGDVEAAFNLGGILSAGRDDLPKDLRGALQWYQNAAELGYASAQYKPWRFVCSGCRR